MEFKEGYKCIFKDGSSATIMHVGEYQSFPELTFDKLIRGRLDVSLPGRYKWTYTKDGLFRRYEKCGNHIISVESPEEAKTDTVEKQKKKTKETVAKTPKAPKEPKTSKVKVEVSNDSTQTEANQLFATALTAILNKLNQISGESKQDQQSQQPNLLAYTSIINDIGALKISRDKAIEQIILLKQMNKDKDVEIIKLANEIALIKEEIAVMRKQLNTRKAKTSHKQTNTIFDFFHKKKNHILLNE